VLRSLSPARLHPCVRPGRVATGAFPDRRLADQPPYFALRLSRAFCPVLKLPGVTLVTRHEDVAEVLFDLIELQPVDSPLLPRSNGRFGEAAMAAPGRLATVA
jgi:hypothetical protein